MVRWLLPLITRRSILGAAVLAGVGAIAQALAEPGLLAVRDMKKEADNAAVYHCNFGDPGRFAQLLNDITLRPTRTIPSRSRS